MLNNRISAGDKPWTFVSNWSIEKFLFKLEEALVNLEMYFICAVNFLISNSSVYHHLIIMTMLLKGKQ